MMLMRRAGRKRACRALALILMAAAFPKLSWAQVSNTSYVSSVGERVLRIECTVPLSIDDTWKLFSTAEGLMKWAAPVASIELHVGGQILTNYDKTKSLKDSSTIRLLILNYLDGQMMTLKVKLNDQFPAKVRREDGNLQEIIQLRSDGARQTHVISSMIGWGVGADWDKAYKFFAAGNAWTYQQLLSNSQK
jgi:hypothetical protein